MFDALRQRLSELETVGERALPAAAIAVRDKLRGDVKANRRAAQKRRKVERALRKAAGDTRRVKMGRATSGVSIDAEVVGSTVVVRASTQVHHIAREKTEPAEWAQIFGDTIREAAQPGSGGRRGRRR